MKLLLFSEVIVATMNIDQYRNRRRVEGFRIDPGGFMNPGALDMYFQDMDAWRARQPAPGAPGGFGNFGGFGDQPRDEQPHVLNYMSPEEERRWRRAIFLNNGQFGWMQRDGRGADSIRRRNWNE